MEDAEQLNSFLVDVFGRINKIEERAMAGGLGSAVSITEIHIIEKIGDREPVRMSEVARSIGVTLATLTVACDKLVAKGLVRRVRSQEDRRVVNIMLTDKGRLRVPQGLSRAHDRVSGGHALARADRASGAELRETAGLLPPRGSSRGGRNQWIT